MCDLGRSAQSMLALTKLKQTKLKSKAEERFAAQ